jgi:ABC-2 type transport system ATP-binding protein
MDDGMIEVLDLVKRYAGHTAVAGISFLVKRGEIVGLLGPNGAGKSTTMRILSCFLSATSGTVRIGGMDVSEQSQEVRRRIGYMPESNPLHPEMRVREYLKFRARLKGLTRAQSRTRVDIVMQQCGLTEVQYKIIGHLSKGYKQRVGLADSLVHEPDLLILDEPTIGLDPHQIRSVRELIKSLAGSHTVLISSHILPEVELTCSRVLILYRGKILAADTPDNLQSLISGNNLLVAEIAAPAAELLDCWSRIPEIQQCDVSTASENFCRCSLTLRDGVELRSRVFTICQERGWVLRELTRTRRSLEDIYVQITNPEENEDN